jgi:uncharacterized membrane protein
MNPMNRQQLWQRLRDHALVDGDPPQADIQPTPWYVRVMSGVAGWIGALFLLGFVALAFEDIIRSAGAWLAVGALCCVGAFFVFRIARTNDFGTQFGLAASIAGQALFVSGLFSAFHSDTSVVYFSICAFEVVLAVLVPNFIHRVFTSWAAMVGLWFAWANMGIHGLAPAIAAAGVAIIWLNELRWIAKDAMSRPIGYGLVLALLQIDAMSLIGRGSWLMSGQALGGWWHVYGPRIGTAMAAVVLLVAVLRLLGQADIAASTRAGIAAIIAAIALASISFVAPGIATAFLILLLGFAAGNRILIGLGLLALGGFLAHYYYQMQSPLLVKSIVLAGSGAILLLARAALRQWLRPAADEENIHA